MTFYDVSPVVGPINWNIKPPGSKSYTNRVLPISAVAHGESIVENALSSEDSAAMIGALRLLGTDVRHEEADRRIFVSGSAGPLPVSAARLDLVNSGTSLRFLTALVSTGRGEFILDGNARMRSRPAGDLLAALGQLGVDARSIGTDDCPPLQIRTVGLPGGRVEVRGETSSQFVSALLIAAALARSPTEIRVLGDLVSKPYVDLTIQTMRDFGVTVERSGYSDFRVVPQRYIACRYRVEPDASSASYWFASAAIATGRVAVEGLGARSLQGDLRFVDFLEQMGCSVERQANETVVVRAHDQPLVGIDVDLCDFSDLVPTLAVVAVFAEGPTTIRNVANIRVKECDRLSASATELRKLGAEVEEGDDWLRITPRPLHAAELAVYDDHRMAMALALTGLRQPGVRIADPACVAKTYPDYWRDFEAMRSTAT